MRVAHKNLAPEKEPGDLAVTAKWHEQHGDWKKAADVYEKITRNKPGNEKAYDRLMIIYRKEREYKKELATIKKALKIFEEKLKPSSRNGSNKKLQSLSRALLKSLDMADNKGKALFEVEPLNRWRKRQNAVERQLGTGKNKN